MLFRGHRAHFLRDRERRVRRDPLMHCLRRRRKYNGPTDVWSDGTRLAVVDNANSRVLIWASIPTTNGQAATIVIGRASFGLGLSDAVADPPTSASMRFPTGTPHVSTADRRAW
jgi:hypothetical protein